jgi:molecular chaperone DnaJ
LEHFICPRCDKGFVVEANCPSCEGNGYLVKDVDIDIKIPPGVENGNILRLSKFGNLYKYTVTDLYITVSAENSNEYFERKGNDVYTKNFIPLSFCVLGGELQIKGLYSNIKFKVDKGVKDGDVIKIDKQGVNGIGDHYVNIQVLIPRNIKNKISINI